MSVYREPGRDLTDEEKALGQAQWIVWTEEFARSLVAAHQPKPPPAPKRPEPVSTDVIESVVRQFLRPLQDEEKYEVVARLAADRDVARVAVFRAVRPRPGELLEFEKVLTFELEGHLLYRHKELATEIADKVCFYRDARLDHLAHNCAHDDPLRYQLSFEYFLDGEWKWDGDKKSVCGPCLDHFQKPGRLVELAKEGWRWTVRTVRLKP